jgi:Family of unknown function (DUF6573)
MTQFTCSLCSSHVDAESRCDGAVTHCLTCDNLLHMLVQVSAERKLCDNDLVDAYYHGLDIIERYGRVPALFRPVMDAVAAAKVAEREESKRPRYSRAQALVDGLLVDLTEYAAEFGIRLPVAITHRAWAECIEWDDAVNARKGTTQDEAGRARNVVAMAAWRLRPSERATRRAFTVALVPQDGRGQKLQDVELHLHCGPGDTSAPVLTIMHPSESFL